MIRNGRGHRYGKRETHGAHASKYSETLFSKHVYLCEGANDELFINEALRQFGGFYDDYSIFKTWGKANLPVFIALYQSLNISISVLFDVDDETESLHKDLNAAIRSLCAGSTLVEFSPRLEDALGYMGNKRDALAFMDHLEDISILKEYDPR